MKSFKIILLICFCLPFNLKTFSQSDNDLQVICTLTISEKLDYRHMALLKYGQNITIDSIINPDLTLNNNSIDSLFYTPIEDEIDEFKIINQNNENVIKFFNFELNNTKFLNEKYLDNKYVLLDSVEGNKYRKYKIKGYCKNVILDKNKSHAHLEFFLDRQMYSNINHKNKTIQLFFIYYIESIEPLEFKY